MCDSDKFYSKFHDFLDSFERLTHQLIKIALKSRYLVLRTQKDILYNFFVQYHWGLVIVDENISLWDKQCDLLSVLLVGFLFGEYIENLLSFIKSLQNINKYSDIFFILFNILLNLFQVLKEHFFQALEIILSLRKNNAQELNLFKSIHIEMLNKLS